MRSAGLIAIDALIENRRRYVRLARGLRDLPVAAGRFHSIQGTPSCEPIRPVTPWSSAQPRQAGCLPTACPRTTLGGPSWWKQEGPRGRFVVAHPGRDRAQCGQSTLQLELQHGAPGDPRPARSVLAMWPRDGRFEFDQQDALCAWRPRRLRSLAGAGLRCRVLRRRAVAFRQG